MRTKASCLFVAILAAVSLVSASGAVTQKANHVVRIDVSTRASVVRYLRSIHVNPAGVVIQRGSRNYAGASCPGTDWNCTTTAHPVVQVASAGGRNTFVCSTASCAAVQVSVSAATNIARCVKAGSVRSTTCSITQSSTKGNNVAIVFEDIDLGLTRATSTATITQTATGALNGNMACVTQNVKLSRSGTGAPFTMDLNAHQTVNISQDATGSGANSARFGATSTGTCNLARPLSQNQKLTSVAQSGGAITQSENAADHGANLTIDIEQNQFVGKGQASGTNNARFVQTDTLTAIANSSNGPVDQTQSSAGGGLLGTINQDSSGVSTASAIQTETQCAAAATNGLTRCGPVSASRTPVSLTQRQTLRVHKGVGAATQTGNTADTFTVNQSATQTDHQGDGSIQSGLVQGDCHTSGTSATACSVNQTLTQNGQQHTNMQSGQNVDTTTIASCVGGGCTFTIDPLTIVGNNATDAEGGPGPIQTYALDTAAGPTGHSGPLVNSFVPDGARVPGNPNGSAVAVEGNEVFYSELSNDGVGPSDGIHVAPFNGGSGGHDLRVLPNPSPGLGIHDLTFSNGNLYALTDDSNGHLQVWELDPSDGHSLAGSVTIVGSDPNADGFTVLPNGNFLINDFVGSCTYRVYDPTGHPTADPSITVPGGVCSGVDTDGSSLYFQTDYFSFTKTDLSGANPVRTYVDPNLVEDVSLG